MNLDPEELEWGLRRFAARKGIRVELAPVREGITLMVAFYAAERVERCKLTEGGDMLLFQWGAYDWRQGQGLSFEVDITRQLIDPDDEAKAAGEEDHTTMWQLSWTYRFALDATLSAIGAGDRWCHTPAGLPEFERFIACSKVIDAVSGLVPESVEARYERV